MELEQMQSLFKAHKERSLFGRYVTNNHIIPLLERMNDKLVVSVLGKSVLEDSIYGLKIGNGDKRILMWSQMHGNETTTTKAIFDLLNTLLDERTSLHFILKNCTIYIIPILNPDGAHVYTRINANQVDLNRDAQNLTQPESKILRSIFNSFKPHFCFNLHGQRTIFSAGNTNKPATLSFLAPAQDETCTITLNRKVAMEVIGVIYENLQHIIPNQVGIYNDAFNLNCVGDTFQNENVPTILFEAGHYNGDYDREYTRELIYISFLTALQYIAKNIITGNNYNTYLIIPENETCYYDIIIRNVKSSEGKLNDIGIQYKETLINNKIEFIPKVVKIENLKNYFGHKEFDAMGFEVFRDSGQLVQVDCEIDFVIWNNEKKSLLMKNY